MSTFQKNSHLPKEPKPRCSKSFFHYFKFGFGSSKMLVSWLGFYVDFNKKEVVWVQIKKIKTLDLTLQIKHPQNIGCHQETK